MPHKITNTTIGYMQALPTIYNNEAHHRVVLEPHLGCILGSGVGTVVNADGTWPDGALSITLPRVFLESTVTLMKEDKNNVGDGGCDPSIQVGLSMTQFWAQDEVELYNFSLLSF
jgi:hypothetical protein